MPSIVQFIHPGGEHGPDEEGGHYKRWNHRAHKRKFLHSSGDYVLCQPGDNPELRSGSLVFWGEWEPPSLVSDLDIFGNELMPRYLHKRVIPVPSYTCGGLQNTDPYVFDGPFRYFVCHQFSASTILNPTKMAKLDKELLIIFGSIGEKGGDNFFQIDTVFVVGSTTPYNLSKSKKEIFTKNKNDKYYDISYLKVFRLTCVIA